MDATNASFKVITDQKDTDREFVNCDALVDQAGGLTILDTGSHKPQAWYPPDGWLMVDFQQGG